MNAADLETYARDLVESWPELTPAQADRLRVLLNEPAATGVAVSVAAPPLPSAPLKFALYRFFDTDGALLYVGITNDLGARSRAHRKSAPWMRFVATTQTVWLDSREEVQVAEAEAIATEKPLFNKRGASADRDERVLAYLIQHHATDLLRLP